MPLNTVNPYQFTMSPSNNGRSVPHGTDSESKNPLDNNNSHNNRDNNPDENKNNNIPYTEDDHGPYQDGKDLFGKRKENVSLFEYPEYTPGYERTGPRGQHFQHGSAANDLPFSGRPDYQERYNNQGMNYMPFARQDNDKELINAIGQLSPSMPFYKWYTRFEYYACCFNLEALFDEREKIMNPRTKFAANRLIDNTVCEQYKSCYRFDEHPRQKLVLLKKFFGRTRMINDIHDDLSRLTYDGSIAPTEFISTVLNLKQEIECGNHNNSFDVAG